MKIFICQNMNGRKDEEIIEERQRLIEQFHIEADELIDSYFSDNKTPVEMLGASIELMGQADFVLIPTGKKNRGVEIEHSVANEYGIPVIYYDTNEVARENKNFNEIEEKYYKCL